MDKKISRLPKMTGGNIANGLIPIVDINENVVSDKTKSITPQVLFDALNPRIIATVIAGTISITKNCFGASLSCTNISTGIYKIISNISLFDVSIIPEFWIINSTAFESIKISYYYQDIYTLFVGLEDTGTGIINHDFALQLRKA